MSFSWQSDSWIIVCKWQTNNGNERSFQWYVNQIKQIQDKEAKKRELETELVFCEPDNDNEVTLADFQNRQTKLQDKMAEKEEEIGEMRSKLNLSCWTLFCVNVKYANKPTVAGLSLAITAKGTSKQTHHQTVQQCHQQNRRTGRWKQHQTESPRKKPKVQNIEHPLFKHLCQHFSFTTTEQRECQQSRHQAIHVLLPESLLAHKSHQNNICWCMNKRKQTENGKAPGSEQAVVKSVYVFVREIS